MSPDYTTKRRLVEIQRPFVVPIIQSEIKAQKRSSSHYEDCSCRHRICWAEYSNPFGTAQ